MTTTRVEERFWTKVDKTSACWLWTGAIQGDGYGVIKVAGDVVYAHRWAYSTSVGPIPPGLSIDHLCRVRACVNPAHLEPVTPYENDMRGDSLFAQNARKTHCKNGHEFSLQNTYIRSNGSRACRACRRVRWHAKKAVRQVGERTQP